MSPKYVIGGIITLTCAVTIMIFARNKWNGFFSGLLFIMGLLQLISKPLAEGHTYLYQQGNMIDLTTPAA